MVTFDKYSGPTLHDGTVPETPISHSLSCCMTIHKSQGCREKLKIRDLCIQNHCSNVIKGYNVIYIIILL